MESEMHDDTNRAVSSTAAFSIRQLMAFQLRIALALVVVVPFVYEIRRYWDRLNPSAYAWIAITFIIPVVALIFLVNQKTLLWIVSLLLITVAGGAIGFLASYIAFPNTNSGDHLLVSAIPAIIMWIVAVRIKNRRLRPKSNAEIVG